MSASALYAVDMPELVTEDVSAYERMAIAMANNPEKLQILRRKLAHNRNTQPLFDTTLFTGYMETAYGAMWDRYRNGLPPASIEIEG